MCAFVCICRGWGGGLLTGYGGEGGDVSPDLGYSSSMATVAMLCKANPMPGSKSLSFRSQRITGLSVSPSAAQLL